MKKRLITLFAVTLACVGVLSAQDHPDGVENRQYKVLLSPSHEAPPIEGVDIEGEGVVELSVNWMSGAITWAYADFHINWHSGQRVELRAMHIHKGDAGKNGPIVIDTKLGPQPASMGSRLFRAVKVMDPAGIDTIQEILDNPNGFYVNIHSVAHPPGVIRGQLQMDPLAPKPAPMSN